MSPERAARFAMCLGYSGARFVKLALQDLVDRTRTRPCLNAALDRADARNDSIFDLVVDATKAWIDGCAVGVDVTETDTVMALVAVKHIAERAFRTPVR